MKDYRRLIYVVLLAVAIVLPLVVRDQYIQHLLVLTFIFAIYALSYDVIIGQMGQFSFGHQAFFGLGAYTSGLLSLKLGGLIWVLLPASLFVCALAGLSIGYISLKRTRGPYLGIVTLGFAMLLWFVCINWREVTYGMAGTAEVAPLEIAIPLLPKVVFSGILANYYLVLALLVFIIYFLARLYRSRFGRALVALRENEDRANSLGINGFRYYLWAFTIAAMLGGVAGFAYAHYLCFITPQTFSIYYIWIVLIMVLVGGPGTLPGPVIGAFIFTFVPEVLRIAEEIRLILFGATVIITIVVLPRGIYPSLASLWDYFIVRRRVSAKEG